jgi:hypothetical protein
VEEFLPRFTSELDETFHSSAPLASVRDHFADIEAVITHYGHLERADRQDPLTVRFTLPRKNHGVATFNGRYTCRWEVVDDHTVRWSTIGDDNNMWSTGEARFRAGGGKTLMEYRHEIVIDLDVNRMLAKVIAGVVREVTRRELRAYVGRMLASVPA